MTENVPVEAGRLFLNHWSNGSPSWSGGPPAQDAVTTVMYVKAYFNSSDAARAQAAEQRCAAGGPRTCTIPGEVRERTPSGSSSVNAPAAAPITVLPVVTKSTTAASAPTSSLPAPGKVPFLSENPENLVGQITYDRTYNCEGCELGDDGKKKKSAASNLRSIDSIGYGFSFGLSIIGMFILSYH
jgi:hypothetical protein